MNTLKKFSGFLACAAACGLFVAGFATYIIQAAINSPAERKTPSSGKDAPAPDAQVKVTCKVVSGYSFFIIEYKGREYIATSANVLVPCANPAPAIQPEVPEQNRKTNEHLRK